MKKRIGLLLCAFMCIITFTKAQNNTMAYKFGRFSGSTGGDDGKVVLYETSGGNISHIYEIGIYSNSCNFPAFPINNVNSTGGLDIYMIRYDANGNAQMLWTWGSATNDVAYCAKIVP